MRSVALSEVPCGAAMTNPGRPFSTWTDPAIGPAGPAGAAGGASAESLPAISPAQPWTTRASPSATLAAPRLVIGAVPDQHGLRHRVLAVVGEGEEHPGAALAEGLEGGLLRREARREVRDRIAPAPAVGDLLLGEDPLEKALVPARDHPPHPRHLGEVDADAEHPAHAPMLRRTRPASSSAMRSMRACSSPSIITRRSDSVPEYRSRMRPAPFMSASRARPRSASPGMLSTGGFSFTATFTSTWGNFTRHFASSPNEDRVSCITPMSCSADTIPSPVVL